MKAEEWKNDQLREEGGRRIDYILLLNPRSDSAPKLETQQIAVNRFLAPKVLALSDHSAVEAKMLLQP